MSMVPSILALLGVLLLAAPAVGQSPTAEDLINRGIEERRAGRPDVALQLFQRAHSMDPTPRTLAQIGLAASAQAGLLAKSLQAAAASRHWLLAEEHLRQALTSKEHEWIRQNEVALNDALGKVRAHVGDVVIVGPPPGAGVYVNGEHRGVTPLASPIRVGEGVANVQITAPGHQPGLRSVTIRPGFRNSVDITLEPISPERGLRGIATDKASTSPALYAHWNAGAWAGLVTAAAGLIAFSWGGAYLLRSQSGCKGAPVGAVCNARPTTRLPGWILVASGLTATVTGSFLFFRNDGLGRPSHLPTAMVQIRGPL